MRCFSCLVLMLFLAGPASAALLVPEASNKDLDVTGVATRAIDTFAMDIYRQLAKEDGNIFFSPYSISSALTMVYAGAKGDTALDMASVLRFENGEALHSSMKALMAQLNSKSGEETGELAVANRLWLDAEETLLPTYMALISENYDGGIEQVDFLKNAERARVTINEWVEKKTRDKIRDLLHEGDVHADTRLVLTNAIYFKSAWSAAFEESFTKEESFRVSAKEQKNVSLMQKVGLFAYKEYPDLQLLKIPYKMSGLSMLILLPRENESFTQLQELEKKLDASRFESWTSEMAIQRVSLRLPKFRTEARYALKDVLKNLGMILPFSPYADFSAMTEKSVLCVDSVIHQSFIDVDEKGTEAAAATAVTMMKMSVAVQEKEPIEFRADRPFIYCILDDSTGTVLFMGRLTHP